MNTAYRKSYSEEGSRRYQDHMKSGKHQAEMQLIDQAIGMVSRTDRILDVPCGAGRVTLHLLEKGFDVTGADVSEGMLTLTRENIAQSGHAATVEYQDLERLSYPDRAFDTTLCFRLFHHLPEADLREAIVAELCRVTDKTVLLSYRSPLSFTSINLQIRVALGVKKQDRYATSLGELEGYFHRHGFRLARDFGRMPLVHTLHLAVWERERWEV